MSEDGLRGVRVLIVEDEMMIAMMLEDMLEDLGCVVVARAARPADAIAAVRAHDCDVAVLDLNLGGESSYGVARELAARGRPFVFSTGYAERAIEPEFRDRPVLAKPFQDKDLSAALRRALAAGDTT